jgi:hypothetical protein
LDNDSANNKKCDNYENAHILSKTQRNFYKFKFIRSSHSNDMIYEKKQQSLQRTIKTIMATTVIIAIIVTSFEILPMSSLKAAPVIIALRGAATTMAASGLIIQSSGSDSSYVTHNNNNYNNKISYISRPQEEHVIAVVFNTGGGGSNGRPGITCMQRGRNNPTSPSTSSSEKNKLVHSSFRIEEDVIAALAKVAQKRGDTLSTLVNKTLKNYVTSEMYFEELGFILVSKDFLRKMFSSKIVSDQKHLEEFGKELGLTVAKEYVTYFFPEVNSHTITQFLDIWFRRFQSCQHRIQDNRHCFSVYHDINMNFSIAIKSMLEGLIEPVIKNPVDFKELTSNAIIFSFEV